MTIAARQPASSAEFLAVLAEKLSLSGGTMTGALALAGDPLLAHHPATKQYLDALAAIAAATTASASMVANAAVPAAGGTMTGALVLAGDPVAGAQASTREYVDVLAGDTLQASPTALAALIATAPTAPGSVGSLWLNGGALTNSRPALLSDALVRTPPTVAKPGYLQTIADPAFGTTVTRITGDPGDAIMFGSGGVWGSCSRHHYSLDQAWNADQTLLYLDTNEDPDGIVAGGVPSGHLFLDGNTYVPRFTQTPPGWPGSYDIRWHPTVAEQMFYVEGDEFGLWTPQTNDRFVIKTFSGYSNLLFGKNKGFYSNDGDVFAFQGQNASSQDCVFAYRVNAGTKFPDILVTAVSTQISARGTYLAVTDAVDDLTIYDLQGNQIQFWAQQGSSQGLPSHADMALDANSDEVMVGVGKGSTYNGRIVKRRLVDGVITALTPASPANYGQNVSARNIAKPGWAFCSYPDNGSGNPLYKLECIAVKLDGTRVLRLCHNHATDIQSNYYSQPQCSPSPTGDRVIFASNWNDPNANGRPVQAYVCDLRGTTGLI